MRGAGVSLNCSIYYIFLDELRRIPLLRTWANNGMEKGGDRSTKRSPPKQCGRL